MLHLVLCPVLFLVVVDSVPEGDPVEQGEHRRATHRADPVDPVVGPVVLDDGGAERPHGVDAAARKLVPRHGQDHQDEAEPYGEGVVPEGQPLLEGHRVRQGVDACQEELEKYPLEWNILGHFNLMFVRSNGLR